MREALLLLIPVILGLLQALVVELVKERGNVLAPRLLRAFGRLLPRSIREHMIEPWVADIELTEGNVSKVFLAFTFMWQGVVQVARRLPRRENLLAAMTLLMPLSLLLSPDTLQLSMALLGVLVMVLATTVRMYVVMKVRPNRRRLLMLAALLGTFVLSSSFSNSVEFTKLECWLLIVALLPMSWLSALWVKNMARLIYHFEDATAIELELYALSEGVSKEDMDYINKVKETTMRLKERQRRMAAEI